MRSHYKRIGDYVTQIKLKNTDGSISSLKGININKHFMPSVANINGTDLSKYRVVKKNQFAFNPMHVGRDEVLPISMLEDDEPIIVSPAYVVFEVKDEEELLPTYLMMWCRRSEFDRNAWFMTDNSVRGGFSWADFCDMELPIPSIEKQREIVREYNVVNDRIALNEQLTKKLEDTAQTIYKQWFVDFEFPISKEYAKSIDKPELEGKPYKSSGGEMRMCHELGNEVPILFSLRTIGNYAKVNSGFAFKSSTWQSNGIPVIKIGSINRNTVSFHDLGYVNELIANKINGAKAKFSDVVIAMTGATIGKIGLVPEISERIYVNQRVGLFELGENPAQKAPFLFCSLLLPEVQEEIQNVGGDSAQANISGKQIEQIPLLTPKQDIINSFNEIVADIFKLILIKTKQNYYLNTLSEIILQRMV